MAIMVGDVSYAPFGQGSNPSKSGGAVGFARVNVATPAPVYADICAQAAAARARNSPTANALDQRCAASRAAGTAAPAAAPAPSANTAKAGQSSSRGNYGCGPEPPHVQRTGIGPRPYVDGAKGKAWLDCIDRNRAAQEAAAAQPSPTPAPPLPDTSAGSAQSSSSSAGSSTPFGVASGGGASTAVVQPAQAMPDLQQSGTPAATVREASIPTPSSSTGLIVGGVALLGLAVAGYFAFR